MLIKSIRIGVVFIFNIKISKNGRREKINFEIVKLLAGIQTTEFRISNPELKMQYPESKIQFLDSRIQSLEFRIQSLVSSVS
jgi:hypothetical protein